MDSSKKSNKIRDIVRLQQLLKKWKHLSKTSSSNAATRSRSGSCTPTATASNAGGSKGMKFLRKTLSFSDSMVSSSSSSSSSGSLSQEAVPKGYLAVCVGKELKRYVIPMEHLSHQAFGMLLREAEEEFGFQQAGVLRIPCEVGVFDMILKVVQEKRDDFFLHDLHLLNGTAASTVSTSTSLGRCSPDSDLIFQSPAHPQLCR